jgi:hypothetical protein
MKAFNQKGFEKFIADETNTTILDSLSLEEMLAMMETPELFTQKKEILLGAAK